MNQRFAFFFLLILLAVGTAAAEEKKAWSGAGEIGFLMTSGNSETESINARANLKYEKGHLLAEAGASALYSSEETESDGRTEERTSAEKYNCNEKLGYKFDAANYVFVTGDYTNDRFSGYDYQSTWTAGYGRKVIATDTIMLNIEAGPGYRYDKRENGQVENEGVFRGYAMFNYKFSESASFQQSLTVVAGSNNTNTRSVSAIKSQLVGALSMKASYTVDHDSSVPPETSKTDTETALTLVYDF